MCHRLINDGDSFVIADNVSIVAYSSRYVADIVVGVSISINVGK